MEKIERFLDLVGGLLIGFIVCALLSILCGCSTTRPVVVERVIMKTDTLYKTNVRADTLRILDSVFVNQYTKDDTVYKEKTIWKWRDKVSIKTDTIYKVALQTDSVRLPIPVERKLSTWEKTQMYVGDLAIGAVVTAIVSLLLWLIHRRK